MINLRNKKIDFVNSATINDAKNYRLISLKKEGKCEQEVIEKGKNIFNIGATPIKTRYATATSIENGIRVATQESNNGSLGNQYVVYSLLDLSNNKYLGKTIRMKCNFIASGENQAKYCLTRSNGVGTTDVATALYVDNNKTISYTVGEITDDRTNLVVFFYGNDNSQTSVVGDHVDYTNIIITIDNEDMTYEPYRIPSPSPDNPSEIKCIKGTNLLKGLSTSTTDTDYWYSVSTPYFTPLEDGWGKFEYDNTSGTSTAFVNAKVKLNAVELKENTNYTLIMEIRNSNISKNAGAFLQMVSANATIAFQNAASLGYSNINSGGIYKSVIKTKESFTGISTAIDTYLRLAKGTKGTVEARISLFEGDVPISDYVPYGCIQIKNVGKNLVNPTLQSYTNNGVTFTNNGDGTYTLNGTSTAGMDNQIRKVTDRINVYKDKFYKLSVKEFGGTKSGNASANVRLVIGNTNTWAWLVSRDNARQPSDDGYIDIVNYYIAKNVIFNDYRIGIQLEIVDNASSSSTEWEQYKSNSVNINLQGNELCSLPNNVKDELIIENGRAKIIKNARHISLAVKDMNNGDEFSGWRNVPFLHDDYPNQNSFLDNVTISFLCNIGIASEHRISINTTGSLSTLFLPKSTNNKLTQLQWKEQYPNLVLDLCYKTPKSYEIDLGAVILPETFEGINNINISSNLDSNTSIVYVNEIVEFKSSLIKVYDSNEKTFASNGIKTLHPLLAEVTKKDNGDYYLELRDTLDNLDYYQKGMIIRCTTPWGIQGFRCDNPIINNKRIECKAWHLSYDSKNYIIKDAYAVDKNCNDALNHFNSSTDKTSPFTCVSDIAKIVSTRAVRKALFEVYEWLITDEKYGGHWYRDNWNLSIKSSIGEDRGVVLAQNKNITDMKISENWDDVCTKILPYTTDGENAILLDDTYVEVGEELYDLPYSKVIKFENQLKQEDYETYDAFLSATKTWLEAQANSYLQENKFPKINYSVSAKIDNISDVGDVIHVKHPKCKVDITTNVIGITYDVNRDKYIKIEFGNFKKEIKNLAQEISETVKKDTENKIEEAKNLLQKELEDSTSKINNTFGNSYVIYEGDKILVVDTLPKENAKYVIKISNGGIGFSQNGINGTFTSAWTIDGTLNMQNINVINLTASLIKGGTLKLGGLNNSSGTFELYDETGRLMLLEDKTGLTVYALNGDYVKLNADVGFAGYNKNDAKIYWADGEVFHMRNAEVENELKVAGMIKFVPINTSDSRGIGIVAIPG